MYTMKIVITRGWSLILVTVISIAALQMNWHIWAVAPTLVVILAAGLIVDFRRSKQQQLVTMADRLRDLIKHFCLTFIERGDTSVFNLIRNIPSSGSPELQGWQRGCDLSKRVLNQWLSRFVKRVDADVRIRKEENWLSDSVVEFCDINDLYYDFVEEFYRKASKEAVTKSDEESYNKLVTEYNAFVQNLRNYIAEFKKVAKIGIEPQSAKFAKELRTARWG